MEFLLFLWLVAKSFKWVGKHDRMLYSREEYEAMCKEHGHPLPDHSDGLAKSDSLTKR